MTNDKVATGALTAAGGSVVTATLLAIIATSIGAGGLNTPIACCSLASGLALGAWAFCRTQKKAIQKPNFWDFLLLTVFTLASLKAFLWLIYSFRNEWRILSPHNLGDLSLHIHFIRYFASGVDFWPASPILTGVPLSYPIGADLWNSLLLLLGVPLELGLIWTALAGAALTAWTLWRWGGAFALAALLFNGGLAGFALLLTGQIQADQAQLAWKNLFLTMVVTQRGLLYALPCGLLLLRAWRDDFFRDGGQLPRTLQIFLYATMPLFSVHTFLFLSAALAMIFLFTQKNRAALLIIVACALIPATTAMWFVTGGFSISSGLRWLPGWMQADQGWKFWAINFGISLPLLVWLLFKCAWRGDKESRTFVALSLSSFLLCFFVAFATWEWDNMKLLIWAWLTAMPFLWTLVIKPLIAIIRYPLCIVLFFSGATALLGGLDGKNSYGLAEKFELAEAAKLLKNVPAGSRIAVTPKYNHPVILLGYPVVCGYEGHLSSHGLPYEDTQKKLRSVMLRESGWANTAKNIGAEWVYWEGRPPMLRKISDEAPR